MSSEHASNTPSGAERIVADEGAKLDFSRDMSYGDHLHLDEILHALRDHFVALNCGRWDYIFSFIKRFSRRPDFVLPDRQQITVTTHFLRSYSLLCIQTCHRRGAMAMGGMAAQIPSGDITEAGLRLNVSVALQYLAAWLSGNGCVPIYHLKEDAATAETSRAQIWQGIRHPGSRQGVHVDRVAARA